MHRNFFPQGQPALMEHKGVGYQIVRTTSPTGGDGPYIWMLVALFDATHAIDKALGVAPRAK